MAGLAFAAIFLTAVSGYGRQSIVEVKEASDSKTVATQQRWFDVSFRLQQFTWQEYSDNGARLLKESGMLYGISTGEREVKKNFGMRSRSTVFFGKVDYDGQNQAGTPVTSGTSYLGVEGNIDLVAVMPVDDTFKIRGFAGLGGAIWWRDIKDSRDITGQPAQGYSEYWLNALGRLGFGADARLADNAVLFADFGMKIPFYTQNRIMMLGSVTVRPKGKSTPFAEIGCNWGNITMCLNYDTSKFDKSNSVGQYQIYQPRSEENNLNFSIGWLRKF